MSTPTAGPAKFRPCCPHCGDQLTAGGFALACGPKGGARIKLPDYCASAACRAARDEAAIARAISLGLIDP